jgi:hypothetical protein
MRCRAIGIFCEDDKTELHRRQHRINESYGIEFDDLDDMSWASAVGDDNALVRFDVDGKAHDTPRLAEFLHAAMIFQARLLVIDTAADTFPDDENKRSAVRAFVSRLNRVALDFQCAVLLNLHPSRSGMRPEGDMDGGSTAWSNTVRSRWSLERPKPANNETPDPHARVLTRRKANYAGIGETLKLTYSRGALEAAARPTGLAAISMAAEADEVFMRLLAKVETGNRTVSESPNAGNFAPKMFAKQPDNGGFTSADFDQAMERLFTAKKIQVVEYGRSGDLRRKLATVTQAEMPLNVPAAVQNGGRKPLKTLCGGSCGAVVRRCAVVTRKSLNLLVRRFCGGLRRWVPPYPPTAKGLLGSALSCNEVGLPLVSRNDSAPALGVVVQARWQHADVTLRPRASARQRARPRPLGPPKGHPGSRPAEHHPGRGFTPNPFFVEQAWLASSFSRPVLKYFSSKMEHCDDGA